jgi:hypothetical protein
MERSKIIKIATYSLVGLVGLNIITALALNMSVNKELEKYKIATKES